MYISTIHIYIHTHTYIYNICVCIYVHLVAELLLEGVNVGEPGAVNGAQHLACRHRTVARSPKALEVVLRQQTREHPLLSLGPLRVAVLIQGGGRVSQ
jgi:hypothetical protein